MMSACEHGRVCMDCQPNEDFRCPATLRWVADRLDARAHVAIRAGRKMKREATSRDEFYRGVEASERGILFSDLRTWLRRTATRIENRRREDGNR